MNRVREIHGGKDYDASFATRMRGTGGWADLMRQRFYKATDRLGFRYNRFELDIPDSGRRREGRGPRGINKAPCSEQATLSTVADHPVCQIQCGFRVRSGKSRGKRQPDCNGRHASFFIDRHADLCSFASPGLWPGRARGRRVGRPSHSSPVFRPATSFSPCPGSPLPCSHRRASPPTGTRQTVPR